MKLTAGQVYSASEAISKLAAVKLPLKGKYWLARIAARLFPEFEVIAGQRNELIKKHGEKKDGQLKLEAVLPVEKDGVKSTVVNPAYALFLADLETLMAQEIEVDCPTVKLELLGDGETDVDLTALLPFIEEPVAPNPGAAKEV